MTSCWGLGFELSLLCHRSNVLTYPHCGGCPWWVWQAAVGRTVQWTPWSPLSRGGRWSCCFFEPAWQRHDSDFTATSLLILLPERDNIQGITYLSVAAVPRPCMHLIKLVLWLGQLVTQRFRLSHDSPLSYLPAALLNLLCPASSPLPGEEAMAICWVTQNQNSICCDFPCIFKLLTKAVFHGGRICSMRG